MDGEMVSRCARRAAAFVALASLGCGGGSGRSAGGGACASLTLSTHELLNMLTPVQAAELCDYETCVLGGYGADPPCSTGPAVTVAPNQQTCVMNTPMQPTCTATVQDVIDCEQALEGNACGSTFLSNSGCMAIFECNE